MSSKLPVEPADGRVGLAKLLAYLYGEAERRCVSELKAGDGMRDPGRAPVIDGEVDASDLRESHGARLPMRGVVGLGPVVAVAYVVQASLRRLECRPRLSEPRPVASRYRWSEKASATRRARQRKAARQRLAFARMA